MRDRDPGYSITAFALATLSALVLAGCTGSAGAPDRAQQPPEAEYVPGLGELMSLQQMRHTKLWFAGRAENWELAAYEVDELQEGFDDVVSFHPTLGDRPVAPRDMVPELVAGPVDSLRAAVERGDSRAFASAYDALTLACNDCHQAMDFGFNQVQVPSSNPYPDQVFARSQ